MNLALTRLTAPDGTQRDFRYRADSPGDVGVMQQVFERQDYAFGNMAQADSVKRFAEQLAVDGKTPLILDLGANIGASAVWFALLFPQARIIAVEPEPRNFALLKANVDGLAVACVHGAVTNGLPAFLHDPGRSDWGYQIQHLLVPGGAQVPSYTVPQLLREHHRAAGTTPLLCKIDVEGSEAEVFENALTRHWVDEFAVVVVETHDWMLPGKMTARNFLRAISACEFDVVLKSENLWCFNNRVLR